MKFSFLTTDDPIYLPAFFDRILAKRAAETAAVYIVPPLYKKQTPAQAAWRYYRTFGANVFVRLGVEVLRAKARKQNIASICARHGVKCEEIADVNAPEFLNQLSREQTELLVSVSCPQIFKQPLIELPSKGILNIHGAILPQYRGVMPSFWMLANEEKQAGVTIYFVNEKIDAGEVCGQRIFEIQTSESLDHFIRRSKGIAADLLDEVLEKVGRGKPVLRPINLAEGSYFSWPTTEAYRRFRKAGHKIW
jgi:methionyl-tRNA formyltransferase